MNLRETLTLVSETASCSCSSLPLVSCPHLQNRDKISVLTVEKIERALDRDRMDTPSREERRCEAAVVAGGSLAPLYRCLLNERLCFGRIGGRGGKVCKLPWDGQEEKQGSVLPAVLWVNAAGIRCSALLLESKIRGRAAAFNFDSISLSSCAF